MLCTSVLSRTLVHSSNTSSHCFHHFHFSSSKGFLIHASQDYNVMCVKPFLRTKRLALKRRRKNVTCQVFTMFLLHTYLSGPPSGMAYCCRSVYYVDPFLILAYMYMHDGFIWLRQGLGRLCVVSCTLLFYIYQMQDLDSLFILHSW